MFQLHFIVLSLAYITNEYVSRYIKKFYFCIIKRNTTCNSIMSNKRYFQSFIFNILSNKNLHLRIILFILFLNPYSFNKLVKITATYLFF